MRHISISPISALLALAAFTSLTTCSVVPPQQLLDTSSLTLSGERDANISIQLFAELEELARIVDISYCVGTTGITNPFVCASRCDEFPNFELVTTFNTGPLMSDSCGYVVLDHGTRQDGHSGEWKQGQSKKPGRIIVAFRGTYSITNTIVDLSTVPQEYIPYPEEPGNSTAGVPPEEEKRNHRFWDWIPRPGFLTMRRRAAYQEVKLRARCAEHRAKVEAKRLEEPERKCQNCTVHTGFWTSWQNTRSVILPHLIFMKHKYPDYELHLVGHSLGGAVAALAGLEFQGADWEPIITTFGEPRVGNAALRDYIDSVFCLSGAWNDGRGERYRRVTHVDDPVPLLPLQEWGYRAHAGEVYISKPSLSPSPSDLRICFGDEDVNCIASAEIDQSWFDIANLDMEGKTLDLINQPARDDMQLENRERRWGVRIPARYKIWQLFFAHRDYFWRLGVCFPGGDPLDWGKPRYNFTDLEIKASEVKVEL